MRIHSLTAILVVMMKIRYAIRGWDGQGCGLFGASRGGGRRHKGIDFVATSGGVVVSHITGKVTKIGYPYNPKDKRGRGVLRYVQVTDNKGLDHRFFYVNPSIKLGKNIRAGMQIGTLQDLSKFYPGITPHFHYEIKEYNRYINCVDWITQH